MKNIRREIMLGILLLLVVLVAPILNIGWIKWLLGVAGVALVVIGLLPDDLHGKIVGGINSMLGKKNT